MDAIEQWKCEMIDFVNEINRRLTLLSKKSNKDKQIMHYLFNLYLRHARANDYQKCAIIHEFMDKYAFYGLGSLRKGIRDVNKSLGNNAA